MFHFHFVFFCYSAGPTAAGNIYDTVGSISKEESHLQGAAEKGDYYNQLKTGGGEEYEHMNNGRTENGIYNYETMDSANREMYTYVQMSADIIKSPLPPPPTLANEELPAVKETRLQSNGGLASGLGEITMSPNPIYNTAHSDDQQPRPPSLHDRGSSQDVPNPVYGGGDSETTAVNVDDYMMNNPLYDKERAHNN